jgi:hypothetical protein
MLSWLFGMCVFFLVLFGLTVGAVVFFVRHLKRKYPVASCLVGLILRVIFTK